MASAPDDLTAAPPNEKLPPVEPPGTGFLLQLFGIPAIIVTIIVVVWLMFNWLAQRSNNIDGYMRAMKHDNAARWQAAAGLADLIRDRHNTPFREDTDTADKLVTLLRDELKQGKLDEGSIKLRGFLCNALGEFRVSGLLDVLSEAWQSSRKEETKDLRFPSLKAITVYIGNNPAEAQAAQDKLLKLFDEAAEDSETLIRSTAAFAYAALETPAAVIGLERLLSDANVDVRCNAATMLARRGQLASVDMLLEMLDDKFDPGVALNAKADERETKRLAIQVNALRAVESLAQSQGPAKLSKLLPAVERLQVNSTTPAIVRYQCAETLKALKPGETK